MTQVKYWKNKYIINISYTHPTYISMIMLILLDW